MSHTKFVVKLQNENVDVGNYQIVDFDLTDIAVDPLAAGAAACIAYFGLIGNVSGVLAGGTSIASVQARPAGSAGLVEVPFPTAALAVLNGELTSAGFEPVTSWTDYPATGIGSGGLCPLGTSISVSELTAQPGRTGRGRHFLPFASAQGVTAGGALGAGQAVAITDMYSAIFLGKYHGNPDLPGPASKIPVVTNAAGSTNFPITSVKVQRIFSNLESRRR